MASLIVIIFVPKLFPLFVQGNMLQEDPSLIQSKQ